MSFLSRITDWLNPPPLRNRPGGMARIRCYGMDYGADAISGWIVTTVRANGKYWQCDPQPQFVVTRDVRFPASGKVVKSGTRVVVTGMPDEYLEPIRDIGDHEQDESAQWLPPVPRTTATSTEPA
jgi:hypothetical protein